MSEYGVKIKNIEAGTLYEYNLGVRDHYEYTNAMFTNSLFSDFLMENGLQLWKEESTRDIICIEFNFGSRSFEEEMKHLNKLFKEYEGDEERTAKLETIRDSSILNKDKYCKKSKEQIRDEFYVNGVDVEYITRNKKGEIKLRETIHYKMLYRTTGKAKKGSCMFVNETLYEPAINFLRMGIELPFENSPIVEIGAYSSLITSTIVGKVHINPKNVLILNDVDSFFETKVVSIETNEQRECTAKTIEKYKLKNTLFDGQALIDSSIFPEWGDGYILLRHHFCKMASFSCHIQKFFQDYYGDEYSTATVTDMFGNEHYVKDIELITTDNAMKWLKFDISYDYWCDWVYANNCMFGIVKTAHKSKLGEVQKMSYQMVNSLDMDIMENVTRKSVDYLECLKKDDEAFLQYLRDNANFSNDFEVLVALCDQNIDFTRSVYFRKRKEVILHTYLLNLKSGKVIQDADNLVIVGSPYAMLLHTVGEDVENDDTFQTEEGTIQCYTGRFKDGEYLTCFRSPFNSKNNMGYLHNVYHEKFIKYFDFGQQIIAINMINTDFQDRNNGSDQDSDSIFTTNQTDIVKYSKYCYENYPTIVNNIPKEKNSYSNTLENFSKIDNNLAAASLAIGESSNLAQIALTYTYNFDDTKYDDYVAVLSVLAQVAIDNAKRRFDINLPKEIKRIKADMDISTHGYPLFWGVIRKSFNKNRINPSLKCPMNYLYRIKIAEFKPSTRTLPMMDFFIKHEIIVDNNRKTAKKVEELIKNFSLKLYIYNTSDNSNNEEYILLRNDFDLLIQELRQTRLSSNYLGLMSWLLDRAFCITPDQKRHRYEVQSKLNKNKSIFIKTLYETNPNTFLKCFKAT